MKVGEVMRGRAGKKSQGDAGRQEKKQGMEMMKQLDAAGAAIAEKQKEEGTKRKRSDKVGRKNRMEQGVGERREQERDNEKEERCWAEDRDGERVWERQ